MPDMGSTSNPLPHGVVLARFSSLSVRIGGQVICADRVTFDPIETDGLRIELQLREGHSGGVLEWRVHGVK